MFFWDCSYKSQTVIGWIVTFIVKVRHGGPSSGYISSGFFGGKSNSSLYLMSIKFIILRTGLTAGRVLLLWVNKKVGERQVVYVYAGLAIGYDFIHSHTFSLSHLFQP